MLNATKWVVEPIVRFTLNLGNDLKDIECVCYIEKFFTSNVLYLLVFQKVIKKMCESTDLKLGELRMNATEWVAESFVRPSGLQIEFRKWL